MTGLYCRCGCKVCRVPDTRHCGGLPNCGVPRARGPASGTAGTAHTRPRSAAAQGAPAGPVAGERVPDPSGAGGRW